MNGKSPLRNLILITEVGLSVIIPIVLFIFLGVFLKDRTGLAWLLPVCIAAGILLGLGAGWGLLKRFAPKESDDEPREEYDLMKGWREGKKEGTEETGQKPAEEDEESLL